MHLYQFALMIDRYLFGISYYDHLLTAISLFYGIVFVAETNVPVLSHRAFMKLFDLIGNGRQRL